VNDRETRQWFLALEEERNAILAYDIHDGLCQQLAAAAAHLKTYLELRTERSREADTNFQHGLAAVEEGMVEARRLVDRLRPPMLEEAGLLSAVEALIRDLQTRNGLAIDFHHELPAGTLAGAEETAVFRIVQEGLSNVVRHSRAATARVELVANGRSVCLRIEDWGVGFDPQAVRGKRFGLVGMQARAAILGGQLSIHSAPGHGTRLVAEIPITGPR
jgi:signal transduction histidine kinase